MSRKAKYTVEQKVQAAEKYLRGEASAAKIAAEMEMPASVEPEQYPIPENPRIQKYKSRYAA